MTSISVIQTQRLPAESPTATWLSQVLEPLCRAIVWEGVMPPLELRPTGIFRGWCMRPNAAPNQSVCVSSKALFWRTDDLLHVYTHEVAHRLLFAKYQVPNHGPQFFCLFAALLMRAKPLFVRNPVDQLALYDCQDRCERLAQTARWQTYQIEWGLKFAAEIADSNLSAQGLAAAVVREWDAHIGREHEDQQKDIKTVQHRAEAEGRAWLYAALVPVFGIGLVVGLCL